MFLHTQWFDVGVITEWLSVCEPQKVTEVSETDGALVVVKQEKRPFILVICSTVLAPATFYCDHP